MKTGGLTPTPPKAVSAVVWTLIQQGGNHVISLAIFVVLVRLLPPEAFGLVAYTTVLLQVFQVIVEGGFSKAIVQREDLEPGHLDTAFWINCGIAAALFVVVQLGAASFSQLLQEPGLEPVLKALSWLFPLNALNEVQQAVLRRRLEFRPLALRTLIAAIVGGLVGVACALAGLGVWALVARALVGAVVGGVVLWVASDWRPRLRLSGRHFRDLFSFGWKVMGTQLLVFAAGRADQLLVGSLLGPAALGLYVVGVRVARMVLELVMKTMDAVALPVFSRMQSDPERVQRTYLRGLAINSALTFPPCALIAASAPDLVPVFFGEEWRAAIPILQVVALAGLIQSMNPLWGPVMNAMGKPSWPMWLTALSLVITIAGIAAAAPWGIVAVAIVTATRNLLLLPVRVVSLSRLTGLSIREVATRWIPPLVASLIGAAVTHLTISTFPSSAHVRLPLALALGSLVYALVLWLIAPRLIDELKELAISAAPQPLRAWLHDSSS